MTDPYPQPSFTPQASIDRLIELLDVEALEVDLFRGYTTNPGWQRVFGGQVVAQALMAAAKTVPADRLAHSLHAYFLRPGDPATPIVYRVERDRDGASFTTRRVIAVQHGRPIFNMAASFQVSEAGLEHAAPLPLVPSPEGLLSELERHQANADRIPEPHRTNWLSRDRPIEFRPVDPTDAITPERRPPLAYHWFRTAAPVNVDPVLARGLVAYASDMTLLDTCLLPHGISWTDPRLQSASLDHAMWFHTTPDPSTWHLFEQDSPRANGGRGLNRGLIFGQDGQLVASVLQEGLMRYRS